MALTDEQKLETVCSAFKKKLDEVGTWSEFKTMLNNLTKEKVKTFIRDKLQEYADRERADGNKTVTHGDDIETLITEI